VLYKSGPQLNGRFRTTSNFSVLKLYLVSKEHVFGAMVLNLIGVCATTVYKKAHDTTTKTVFSIGWQRISGIG
jgi:hypothetical protein